MTSVDVKLEMRNLLRAAKLSARKASFGKLFVFLSSLQGRIAEHVQKPYTDSGCLPLCKTTTPAARVFGLAAFVCRGVAWNS